MSYTVQVPGFESRKIELKAGAFSNSLLVDGQPAPKDPTSKNQYVVDDDNGQQQRLTLQSQGLDLPALQFNGETYHFAPPVGLGSKIFAAVLLLPLLLAGGALGGGLAGAGFVLGMSVYRTEKPAWLQHLIMLALAGGAWGIYLVLAVGLQVLLHS